jgi:proline iminopeptidase
LGLAYAEQFPERLTEMVIAGVTTTRQSEIDWLYRGIAPLFPEQWERFRAGVPKSERDSDLVAAYYRLLHDADPDVREKAASDWHDWEIGLMSLDPDAKPSGHWLEPDFRMARARICAHYFSNLAWLEEGVLLREAAKLEGIPGVFIHGRLDLGSPLVTAWELAQAWTTSELVVVKNASHSTSDPGMGEAIIAATNRFAKIGQ